MPTATPERGEEDAAQDMRTFKLKMLMRRQFDSLAEEGGDEQLSFSDFVSKVSTRRALAGTFYHVLLLASTGQLECAQEEPYGDIILKKSDLF